MCSISGFYNSHINFSDSYDYYYGILTDMNLALKHRGPDSEGILLTDCAGMSHTRLSIRDIENGGQPMVKEINGGRISIIYNGEIYNADEIRARLTVKGMSFDTTSDTEVLLNAFICYGADFIEDINGIFSFAIYDDTFKTLYLYRDAFGVKPLYYTKAPDGSYVFASEIKGLFCYPGVNPTIDKTGLCEIFGLGPSKTPGTGVFKDIYEVKPGHYIKCSPYGLSDFCFFRLKSAPHTDSYEDTVAYTRYLVTDSIKRQLVSDVPVCSFLSGGIDSSIVTSVSASLLSEKNKQMNTFSFDFTDNSRYFKSNSFQPAEDLPYVNMMKDYLGTNHTYLTCDIDTLTDYLTRSVISRDLPTMADVDSSLLYFCEQVSGHNRVVLTGECADEVFGGYPWFYRSELISADTFPWMCDTSPRTALLDKDFAAYLDIDKHIEKTYNNIVSEVNILPEESVEDAKKRRISYMNIVMFMQTLLDRMDRTSMFSGLEARVPFADIRLVQYMYNVPWKYKYRNGVEKSLLRDAAKGLLPDEVLNRKKSPYPKTYNPYYEKLLSEKLYEIIMDESSPVNVFLDKEKVLEFLKSPKDYGRPWFGQLMAGPQMMAYLLQINYWLKEYNISLEI